MSENLKVKMDSFTLGTIISRFTIPEELINEINTAYDNAKDLKAHNSALVGKIKNEFNVTDILNSNIKNAFTLCFQQYLKNVQKPWWHVELETAWVNDMKADEYNPFHFHTSTITDLGLSSVLMLKRPSTYGKEYSREDRPTNGCLDFTGGQQDPLSIPQIRFDAKVGELYVFPYTVLHGVYPFNGTDEIRRTLSYNCNLHKPATVQQVKDNNNA